jgi:hypothetical protein
MSSLSPARRSPSHSRSRSYSPEDSKRRGKDRFAHHRGPDLSFLCLAGELSVFFLAVHHLPIGAHLQAGALVAPLEGHYLLLRDLLPSAMMTDLHALVALRHE